MKSTSDQPPIEILSLGAGVQSSVLSLMAAEGLLDPPPDVGIMADTGSEPAEVYTWLDWLIPRLNFPVMVVRKQSKAGEPITLHEASLRLRKSKVTSLHYVKHQLPVFTLDVEKGRRGKLARQCTEDFKLTQIQRVARAQMRAFGRTSINMWIGISTDEITRMKPSRLQHIVNQYPLIDRIPMSRQDCLDWMHGRGYPAPPRSACFMCPYRNDEGWLRMQIEQPTEFARAVQYEKDYQAVVAKVERLDGVPFLHDSRVPLHEIDFAALAAGPEAKTNWHEDECEGICGV